MIFVLALCVFIPFMPAGYAIPKLLILSTAALRLPSRRLTSMDAAVATTWALLLAATIYSVDPYQSVVGHYNDWTHALVGIAIMTSFLIRGTGEEPKTDLLARTALILAGLAVLERLMSDARWTTYRSRGTIGDPVALGSFFALACPLVVHHRRRWLPVLIAGLWSTGSRGAWLAAILGALAW